MTDAICFGRSDLRAQDRSGGGDTRLGEVFRAQLGGSSEEAIGWLRTLPGDVHAAYEAGPTSPSASHAGLRRPRCSRRSAAPRISRPCFSTRSTPRTVSRPTRSVREGRISVASPSPASTQAPCGPTRPRATRTLSSCSADGTPPVRSSPRGLDARGVVVVKDRPPSGRTNFSHRRARPRSNRGARSAVGRAGERRVNRSRCDGPSDGVESDRGRVPADGREPGPGTHRRRRPALGVPRLRPPRRVKRRSSPMS